MGAFRDLLNERLVILDGGLATELERLGEDLDDPLWSAKVLLTSPDSILRVHRDYLEAGADVITTATYQATFAGLERRGLSREDAAASMSRAVELARRARDQAARPKALIAGSIGSYGAFLADGSEYRGDYGISVDELVAFHMPRLELLAPQVDVIGCETVPCLAEARALAACLAAIDTEAWVSFSCRDARSVCHGEPLAACLAILNEVPQVVALGVNCTAPRWIPDLVQAARDGTDRPILVYPNSGERYDDGGWQGDALGPEAFAAAASRWIAAGARAVGGCCRTSPAHIAALRRLS